MSFFAENFQFLVVKFSIHLNRCVFVMSIFVLACSIKGNLLFYFNNGSYMPDLVTETLMMAPT